MVDIVVVMDDYDLEYTGDKIIIYLTLLIRYAASRNPQTTSTTIARKVTATKATAYAAKVKSGL